MKCQSKLFLLAEVSWLRSKKILSPFLRSRLVGGEGRGKFKTKLMISTVAVTPGRDEISELKLEMFGHHLQVKTLTAESDVIVEKDHGYGGENRSQ
jgi:hypothetical protein